ncbi:MAG TPA: maleylpyruvate isomerase family mycothiol-dependent enzyme [Pseudonocardiaceae bacterium]
MKGVSLSLATAYEQTRAVIRVMIDSLDDQGLSIRIPACPLWTVRDLIAHMTGVAADAAAGRFPAVNPHGTWAERQAVIDAFTAGHVTDRRRMGLNEVLAEWSGYLPRLSALLRGDEPLPPRSMPALDWVVVSDIAAHGQDLRGALGRPGDRDSAAVALGLQRYVTGLGQRLDAAGLPALRLCTDDREYVAGSTSPLVSVGASQWELFRGLGSRRSASQLRALGWSGDPEQYVPLIPAYGARVEDLIE